MSIHIALASVAGKPGRRSQDCTWLAGEVSQGSVERELRIDAPGIAVAVAAGIGPCRLGARASRLAIELLAHRVGEEVRLSEPGVRAVQRAMGERAYRTRDIGMATTLASLQIDSGMATVLNVGDSPVYRWRDGFLCQKSVDHTVGRRMVHEGIIDRDDEMAAAGHYDNLDSALYADPFADQFDVHEARIATRPGDLWLVCSRGVRRVLAPERIADVLRAAAGSGPGVVARSVASAAGDATGVDVTVIALEIG
jgi:protein phosphatase